MLSVEEFDALSRAEMLTYARQLDDEYMGMPSLPSEKELQAYRDEGKTPPDPGPGPFRVRRSALHSEFTTIIQHPE